MPLKPSRRTPIHSAIGLRASSTRCAKLSHGRMSSFPPQIPGDQQVRALAPAVKEQRMSFPGTGKIWMNGSLVDWADAKIHVASHVVHYGSAVFEGARCYSTPNGSACFRLDAHMRRLYDSAKIYRMEPEVSEPALTEAVAGDHPRQRVQGVLHPADRLPRLRGARRQSVPVPDRHRDPDLGMGRLSGRRRPRAGGRRPGQLVGARGAEHVPDAGQELGATTPIRS